MTLNLSITNPLENNNWDEQISEYGHYSFFHTSAWAKVLNETYNYIPNYLTNFLTSDKNILVPLMEVKSLSGGKKGVSLPFTDTCELIIPENIHSSDILEFLINHAKSKNWKYLEFRDEKLFDNETPASVSFYEHRIKLSKDIDNQLRQFRSSTIRNIKKAQNNNIQVKISSSVTSLEAYYSMHCLTRKRQGVPPQPPSFFKNISKYILSKNFGNIFLASINGEVIAGMVFFYFGKKAVYKFGASKIQFQSLRANNLLMWEAIKYFAGKGYHEINLGRTELQNQGLRRYKNGWNVEETIRKYYKYNLKSRQYESENVEINKVIQKTFKKLPTGVLKFIGKIAYRYQG